MRNVEDAHGFLSVMDAVEYAVIADADANPRILLSMRANRESLRASISRWAEVLISME